MKRSATPPVDDEKDESKEIKLDSPKTACFLYTIGNSAEVGLFYVTGEELIEWVQEAPYDSIAWIVDEDRNGEFAENDFQFIRQVANVLDYKPTAQQIKAIADSICRREAGHAFTIPADAQTFPEALVTDIDWKQS